MATTPNGSPPYLSYKTFRNFLDSLAEIGVPNRIDRSLLQKKNGKNQTGLINAVRFLGLVSEHGVSAAELAPLAKSEGAERRRLLRQILTRAYPELLNSEFNLEAATTEEIEEVFRKQGVSSHTIRKCVTFFSQAAKDAGIKLSPHVKPYAGTRPSTRRERARKNVTDSLQTTSSVESDGSEKESSTHLKLYLAKIPDFDPTWKPEVRDNWFLSIERLEQITSRIATANGSSRKNSDEGADED